MDVYSTNCPKCKILIKKLTSLGKDFNLVENEEKIMEASAKYEIQEAPFVVIDEKAYNFSQINKMINEGLV